MSSGLTVGDASILISSTQVSGACSVIRQSSKLTLQIFKMKILQI